MLFCISARFGIAELNQLESRPASVEAVSYTHLTLPTKRT